MPQELGVNDLIMIIGMKEVELITVKQRLEQLTKENEALKEPQKKGMQ